MSDAEENVQVLQLKTLQIAEKMMNSCRLCLHKPNIENGHKCLIFDCIDEESPSYSEIAMSMAKIEITANDSYTKLLCQSCAEKLQLFYEFQKKCELSHSTLKAVITLGESIKKDIVILNGSLTEYIEANMVTEPITITTNDTNNCIIEDENLEIFTNIEQLDDTSFNYSIDDTVEESFSIYNDNEGNIITATSDDVDLESNFSLIEVTATEVPDDIIQNEISTIDQSNLINISETISLEDGNEFEIVSKTVKKVTKKTEKIKPSYQCEECGKTYARKSDWKQHSVVHTGVKRFRCDLCDSFFTRKSHLLAHMLIHNEIKPYKCDVCDMSFRKIGNRNRHKVVHVNKFNFSCERCGRLFKRAAALTSHMRTHSGLRPYKCDICSNCYTSYSGYKSHLLKRHNGNRQTIKELHIKIEDIGCTDEDDIKSLKMTSE